MPEFVSLRHFTGFFHLILYEVSFSFILQIRKMTHSKSDASAWIQIHVQTDCTVVQTLGISNIHRVFERRVYHK